MKRSCWAATVVENSTPEHEGTRHVNLAGDPVRLVAALLIIGACVLLRGGPTADAAENVQVLALVGGQPDDITVSQGHLVWGDLARGTIDRLDGHRVVTIARGLSVPEGIVALEGGTLVVAEQGRNRIDRVGNHGVWRVVYRLNGVRGQEGVDGIGRDPHSGALLVPDSPHGTVLEMSVNGTHAHVIAHGLGRPVDAAVGARGDVLVPDEHLGTLVLVSPRGHISHLGRLSIPDDVAVGHTGRIWITSLGDGGLWTSLPGRTPHRVLSGLANPQGLTLDRCGDPVVVEQNARRIVRLLLTAHARSCPF